MKFQLIQGVKLLRVYISPAYTYSWVQCFYCEKRSYSPCTYIDVYVSLLELFGMLVCLTKSVLWYRKCIQIILILFNTTLLIFRVTPSQSCGPFKVHAYENFTIIDSIGLTIETTIPEGGWTGVVRTIVNFIPSIPSALVTILLLG